MAEQRSTRVKNKNPNPVQITAEQILRETHSGQETPLKVPKQRIADKEELDDYRLRKRKGFEDSVRRNRNHVGNWLKYAAWEESQDEFERVRSIFERAIEIEHRNQGLWLRYAEFELKHRNINSARNILDRAVSFLPRVDAFWFKFVHLEESLDSVPNARQVFERWLKWEPQEGAWMAYVQMEKRYGEIERAREIFRRFVEVHPEPKNWLKWSKFEEQNGTIDRARAIYEQCIEQLGEELIDQNIYVSFARFETRQKEIERARAIFKYALGKLPKHKAENLYNQYSIFEKQFGAKDGIEDVIITKRRMKYEEEVTSNPMNYDVWFDYIRLEEDSNDFKRIREVFERAISNVPLTKEKRFWRRYIYLWLFYAVWEESVAKDLERAKEVYNQCLKIIPHKSFTFAKVWLQFARFHIRRMDVNSARKLLGQALGICPTENLYKGYIELETQLREFDRVRILYEKYLQWNAANCHAWIMYAELESELGDNDRSRGIFEIAVGQEEMDMPEILWKAYIDFEIREEEWDNARKLYERLLEKTSHVKVWISFANFELNAQDHEDLEAKLEASREVFNKAYSTLKRQETVDGESTKDERVILLEAWLEFEKANNGGDQNAIQKVQDRMPKTVKRRRQVVGDDGVAVMEEYFDYIFPDDETERPNFKLLAMAHKWKMGAAGLSDDDDSSDEDEEMQDATNQGEKRRRDDSSDDGDDDDEDDRKKARSRDEELSE
ncbi:Crooked neck-like protein 1 [Nowakowskiella sp. JEL0407]|nr:Crooked neck-like protein 1 [Nowakowskiella sp. JEL0407]